MYFLSLVFCIDDCLKLKVRGGGGGRGGRGGREEEEEEKTGKKTNS